MTGSFPVDYLIIGNKQVSPPKPEVESTFINGINHNTYISFDKVNLKLNDLVYQIAQSDKFEASLVEYRIKELGINGEIIVENIKDQSQKSLMPRSVHSNKKELIKYWYVEIKYKREVELKNLEESLYNLYTQEFPDSGNEKMEFGIGIDNNMEI